LFGNFNVEIASLVSAPHDSRDRLPSIKARRDTLFALLICLASVGAFFIVDPSLGDADAAAADAVQPSKDGAVAQVKGWIEEHTSDPGTVKYHEWYNDVRAGKHFTAVDCTFSGTRDAAHSHLLFQLDPHSGLISAIMDLDNGIMIDP
jgi:hypothetical protein